jgi:hypothetical protein
MKTTLILAAVARACGAAFAQAPAGVVKNPSQEANPNASGGKAQVKGEMNAQAKGKDAGMGASAGTTATMGHKGMDLNGDGMISRKEWDAYHGKAWGSMKANKQGMVPWTDVEASMKGGPN